MEHLRVLDAGESAKTEDQELTKEATDLYLELSQEPELEQSSNKNQKYLDWWACRSDAPGAFWNDCRFISIYEWQSHAKSSEKNGITSQPLKLNNEWQGIARPMSDVQLFLLLSSLEIAITRDIEKTKWILDGECIPFPIAQSAKNFKTQNTYEIVYTVIN